MGVVETCSMRVPVPLPMQPNTDTVVGGIHQGTPFAYDGCASDDAALQCMECMRSEEGRCSQLLCTLSSRYATAHSIPGKDAQQDISDVAVTHAGGVTTLQFTRQRVTGDNQDLPLDSPFHLLFAWDGQISGVEVISYHGPTRAASNDLITLPTAQQCPSERTRTLRWM